MSRRELVFLDSSTILRYLRGDREAKKIILDDGYAFAVNDVVINEAAFCALRASYENTYGEYKFYDMKERIAKLDDKVLAGYTIILDFIKRLKAGDQLTYLIVTYEMVLESIEIAKTYGLLPSDAIIAATCKHYNINTIASFDAKPGATFVPMSKFPKGNRKAIRS